MLEQTGEGIQGQEAPVQGCQVGPSLWNTGAKETVGCFGADPGFLRVSTCSSPLNPASGALGTTHFWGVPRPPVGQAFLTQPVDLSPKSHELGFVKIWIEVIRLMSSELH